MGLPILIMSVVFVVGLLLMTSAMTEDNKTNILTLVKFVVGAAASLISAFILNSLMDAVSLMELIKAF